MKRLLFLGLCAAVLAFSGPSYSADSITPVAEGKAQSAKLIKPGAKATVRPKSARDDGEFNQCENVCRHPSTQKRCCLCQEGVWKCSDGRCSCYYY